MKITVEKAISADVNAIAAAESEYIDCPWTAEQIFSEIERDDVLFLVAKADGEFAGYVSGVYTLDECEMSNIAVAARFRRHGIGRELMNAFIGSLKTLGVNKIYLLVRCDNTAAVKLYESCGFGAVGTRRGYYKGQDAIIMLLS